MLDLHSHILPGVDDGAETIEEAVAIAREAERQGIRGIVATPHYLEEGFQLSPEETDKRVKELQHFLKNEGISITVYPGAEVFITPDLGKSVSGGFIPTLNHSKYILIELPFNTLPGYTDEVLYDLLVMGYTPIIAHPERYIYIHKDPNILYNWIQNGIYAQLNAGSLIGNYGNRIKKNAEVLIKHNLLHLIGSDVHSNNRRRECLEEGYIKLKEISSHAEEILMNNERVIKNQQLTSFEPVFYKKDGFISRVIKGNKT